MDLRLTCASIHSWKDVIYLESPLSFDTVLQSYKYLWHLWTLININLTLTLIYESYLLWPNSVSLQSLLLWHSSTSLHPALLQFVNCLYHCYIYHSLPSLITVILSKPLSLNYPTSSRSRTLLLVLSLKLRTSCHMTPILRSLHWLRINECSNTSSSPLPTKLS